MTDGKTYSEDDLGMMWCRLNAWKHPTSDKKTWPKQFVDGAMVLIGEIIGNDKCLEVWNGKFRTANKVGWKYQRKPKPSEGLER